MLKRNLNIMLNGIILSKYCLTYFFSRTAVQNTIRRQKICVSTGLV